MPLKEAAIYTPPYNRRVVCEHVFHVSVNVNINVKCAVCVPFSIFILISKSGFSGGPGADPAPRDLAKNVLF
jgi:hypothetical protein